MPTRAQLKTDGTLEITGVMDSRLPKIINGLISHYNFDNTPSPIMPDISNLKVLAQGLNAVHPLLDWFNTSSILTETTTIETDNISTIVSNYNLVVIDQYVWGISSGVMSRVKELVDAGVSVIAMGNDTRTNVFVKTYTAVVQGPYTIQTIYGETYAIGGDDVIGGIDELHPGIKELYRRMDSNQIMGYIYQSPISGAILFYDQDATISVNHELIQDGIKTAIDATKGGHIISNVSYDYLDSGIFIEEETTNKLINIDKFSLWSKATNSGSLPTVTENDTIAPNGRLEADRMIVPNDGAYPRISQTFTVSNTNVHTLSIYMKSNTINQKVELLIFRNSPWSTAGGKWTANLTTDWVRYVYTFTPLDTTPHQIYIGSHDLAKGNDLFLWGIQIEEGPTASSLVLGSRPKGQFAINKPFMGSSGSLYMRVKMTNLASPTAGYKTVYGNLYSNNAFFTIMNSSNGMLYGYFPNTESSHTYYDYGGFIPSNNEEFDICITWNGATFKRYLNGNLIGTQNDCDGARIASSINTLYIGSRPDWRNFGLIKKTSIYKRDLTAIEVAELSKDVFNLRTNGDLNNNINTEDIPGWTKVYDGLCTQLMTEETHQDEILDYYGEDVHFDEMMIRSVNWDSVFTMTTTETAKLKNSIKWYARWLDLQDDSTSPKMKFHGLDDVHDVGFTSVNTLFYGYGNSWRCVTPVYYVAGTTSMFLGGTTGAIVNEDWEAVHGGTTDYAGYMNLDYPRENGIYKLTPKQYQRIQIYVRLRTSGTLNTRLELSENTVNVTTITTKEVL